MESHQRQKEVDLNKTYASVKNNSIDGLSKLIKLLKKNLIPLLLILICGYAIGYAIDYNFKKYKSTIIVSPNFKTSDFLYEKIELLGSKLAQGDTIFLKENKISGIDGIRSVTIEAIPDIYKFASNNETYFHIFQTLATNANAGDVIKDYTTSKNYSKHKIEIKSIKPISEKLLKSIVKYLNTSDYYEEIRKIIHSNVQHKINMNNEVIAQIDDILNEKTAAASSVYIKEDNNLNDLVSSKLELVHENHELSTTLHDLKYIITPIDTFINMYDYSSYTSNKWKYIIPLFFMTVFLLIKVFIYLDRIKPNEVA